MLYDNGQLASTYLDAFCLTGKASYARVTRGILDYLRRDMTHPDGGIFSAEVRPPVLSSQDSLLYVSEALVPLSWIASSDDPMGRENLSPVL